MTGFGMSTIGYIVVAVFIGIILLKGIRTIRPTHRAVIETLGKFTRVQYSGLTYVFPIIQKLYALNITEQITEAEPQEIITLDRLNATVDAQVYYKVRDTDEDIKKAFYKVNNYKTQIIALARTTMRNVIGNKEFKDVNSNRTELNQAIRDSISVETTNWGIDIVRCEINNYKPIREKDLGGLNDEFRGD